MNKKILIILILLLSNFSFSQDLNAYKYAIVPSKFSFLKENDQYRLNTLTKMFMEKYGFVTFLDTDILPEEVANHNCNTVFVEVQSISSMLSTKTTVVLKDCRNTVLFTSSQGKSREKEYKIAYNQSLREAFNSFDALNHQFQEGKDIVKPVLKEENMFLEKANKPKIILEENSSIKSNLLFAQPIENGFQLIDATPKVVMKIFNTSNPNCFIAIKDAINGVLIMKENEWSFEYYKDQKRISEKILVKF